MRDCGVGNGDKGAISRLDRYAKISGGVSYLSSKVAIGSAPDSK